MAAAAGGTNPLVSSTKPQSVLEAAQLALELSLRNHKFARSSKIPLLTHQTWKTLNPEAWPPLVQESVEGWLNASTGVAFEKTPEMAYILWDDDGMDSLIKQYEPDLWRGFQQLPFPVEKADAFRVTVLRWFGGFVSSSLDCACLYTSDLLRASMPTSTSSYYSTLLSGFMRKTLIRGRTPRQTKPFPSKHLQQSVTMHRRILRKSTRLYYLCTGRMPLMSVPCMA